MENLKEKLWSDYKDAHDILGGLNVGSNEYNAINNEVERIRNELLKLEQIENEKNLKILEIENENKREKIKNIINITMFTVSSIISLITINKTFKFDQEATITSTLGKNILNGVIPKFFKH